MESRFKANRPAKTIRAPDFYKTQQLRNDFFVPSYIPHLFRQKEYSEFIHKITYTSLPIAAGEALLDILFVVLCIMYIIEVENGHQKWQKSWQLSSPKSTAVRFSTESHANASTTAPKFSTTVPKTMLQPAYATTLQLSRSLRRKSLRPSSEKPSVVNHSLKLMVMHAPFWICAKNSRLVFTSIYTFVIIW